MDAKATVVQSSRLLQINTPLGPDTLVVRSLQGREAISELFEVDVELASTNASIDMTSLVGRPATLILRFDETRDRYISGIINRFSAIPTESDELSRYRARLVPSLWLLTRTANCAIFQNKTTPEIVEAILQKYGITNYKLKLRSSYMKREYCVQYRETAFDFVSRLLEEEGICYFFEHAKDSHTLILSDFQSFHTPSALEPEVAWERSAGSGASHEENQISHWTRNLALHSKKWTQADFKFEKPNFHLIHSEPTVSTIPDPAFELYDYPGRFGSAKEAEQLTRVRMEQEETGFDTVSGESNCRGFVPGYTFRLKQARPDQAGSFLLTGLDYRAEQGSLYGGDSSPGSQYQNRFTAIPAAKLFRPARATPRPLVHGPQTAFVTGPAGEELWVDQYGRVKVQFHWDREGKSDENSSCWMRVSQTVAGKGWGSVQLPRVGHEVIVTFLEGDPDRPLVTGSVYNADHVTPYKLPDERSKMTLKTLSYPGGGGFNEIRLDDKKGSEQVFLHGEKDLDVRIKNDRKEWIGRDRHLIVERDKAEQVSRDQHATIQRDLVEQISRDHHLAISGKEAISITGSHSLAIQGDVIEQFSANQSTQVTGSCYIQGRTVVIEAMTGLTVKVGSNFITINSAGIQMQGTIVDINGGGAALSGTPGNLVSPIAPLSPAVACDAKTGTQDSGAGGAADASKGSNAFANSSSSADAPWHDPNNPANKDKKSWIEIELLDQDNKPVPGEPYRVTLPDGSTLAEGTLDELGCARVDGIDPGSCKVTFPQRDKRTWKPK